MKLSKKTLIIGLSILAIAGAGVGYYLSNKDSGEVKSWSDSNWLYRKSVTVSNAFDNPLTNTDVLLTIDSAFLISAGKLQSNCNDFRFVDDDGSTYLTYWIEGGCNTSSTNIWVRIPTLPVGGKTIYMYYGNASAASSSAAWSGQFTLLADASCPSGWTRNSDFDGKFIYGSTTYGTTGGADNHNHGGSLTVTSGGPSATVAPRNPGAGGMSASSSNHTHTAAIPISSTTVIPPYLTMIFCKSANLNIASGLISTFDTSSLPSNWTHFTALDNKFPYGGSTYGATGGAATHTHTVTSVTSSTGSGTLSYDSGYANYQVVNLSPSSHTHTANPTITTESNMPPYLTMVYAKASDNAFLTGIIAITSAVPPLGWTQYTNLNNEFAYGGSTYGTTGGATTHTHTITVTFAAGSTSDSDGCCSAVAAGSHTHTGNGTTAAASNIPPYTTAIYAQRKTSQTATVGTEEIRNTVPNTPTTLLTEGASNPISVTDTSPEFSAIFTDPDTADTGNYYQIQVNTASDFSGTTMWDSTKTAFGSVISNGARSSDISYAGTTLQVGTTYYWRIKFWDNNTLQNESNWSATAQFTMNATPTAPTSLLCQSATNPAKVYTSTPTFSAIFSDPDTADKGSYYQIRVNTQSDFNGTSMWDSGKLSLTSINNGSRSQNLTYAGSTLQASLTYYWEIKFWDNNGNESTWSSPATFTMSGAPTATNLLTNSESNPIELSSVPPYFSALYTDPNGDNATAYEIQVNSNSLFTGTTMWDSGKVSTTISSGAQSSGYQYNGTAFSNSGNTYYWRIKFWDVDDNAGNWSSSAQFIDTFKSTLLEGLGLNGIKIN